MKSLFVNVCESNRTRFCIEIIESAFMSGHTLSHSWSKCCFTKIPIIEIAKICRAVKNYFWLRPYALPHLEDKEFRKSFVRLIYMHHNTLDWYIKVDKEVKNLQSLTISLEKERNELHRYYCILVLMMTLNLSFTFYM